MGYHYHYHYITLYSNQTTMSLERSTKNEPEKSPHDGNQYRLKGPYTQQGFYRKNNNSAGMNFSNLSQKQSIYDHKYGHAAPQATSEFGYSTLNPLKYPFEQVHAPKEEEYEIVIEFQLKREREKNRILEERLKNKEIFISQMKEVQNQLTDAFQKCQEELQFYKKKTIQAREYLQEINELKHLVIRLEDKITDYQNKQNRRYSSVKREKADEMRRSVSKFRDESGRGSKATREKRSKTVVHQADSSPEFKKFDIIEQYLTKYPRKVANFISQFLAMVECFSEEAQKAGKGEQQQNVKRRLKIGWKWVKQIVAEWNFYKGYAEKCDGFHKKIMKILSIQAGKTQSQSMERILNALQR